jgi:hypothetical protein
MLYRTLCDKKPLIDLKNFARGGPMLVVGNGPSLNETPLGDFTHVPSIGMNKIDLLFHRTTWRPSLIICANTLVVMQHVNSFKRSDIPVYLGWKSRWFIKKPRGNVSFYLNLDSQCFSRDLTSGTGLGGTVTFDALQFAFYMGANPVVLFGVDHSFESAGKPLDIVKRSGPDNNHFDPNYFKDGTYWGIPDLDLSEKSYRAARHAFEVDNRKVYDATIGGQLNVFEKISLTEARELSEHPIA